MILGAHESIGGGFHLAVKRAVEDGCKTMQIFTKPPQAWKETIVGDEAVDSFKSARAAAGIDPIVSHASYLVNICAPNVQIREKSIKSLIAEAVRCDLLGIDYLVFHPGSPGDMGEAKGIALVAEGLTQVIDASTKVVLLVETTAGQGKSIGYAFEHLSEMIEKSGREERLGVCLDTCHAFAAGYDLSSSQSASDVIDEMYRVIGKERLKAIHLNDSKKEKGSRVDRHELIGRGEIGIEIFRWMMNDPRFSDMPGIVETPIDPSKGETYAAEIALLRSLATGKKKRPLT